MQLLLLDINETIPHQIKGLYEQAFPLYERRPWSYQQMLVTANKLQLKQVILENIFAGFIFYWKLSNCIFIEHFAIDAALRGKGTGAAVMKQMAFNFVNIVLETEPAQKSEEARRRITFYQNLGYRKFAFPYQQPPYANEYPWQEMDLMHNTGGSSEANFNTLKKEIYSVVYDINE